MAAEVRTFAATIPAGTPIASPAFIDMAMPPRLVRAIRWRVPTGPFGQMGFAFASGRQQIFPWQPGTWIVANDEDDTIPLYGMIESGAWQLMGYNLGLYDHTVYVTFQLDIPGVSAAGGALQPLTIAP